MQSNHEVFNVIFICDQNVDTPILNVTTEAQKALNALYPVNVYTFNTDNSFYGDQIDWVRKNTTLYPTRKCIAKHSKRVYNFMEKDIDSLMFLISKDNWQNSHENPLWGVKRGGQFHSYEVSFTKEREDYLETLVHEFMHMLDTFCKRHAGMSIAQAVGVEDWDRDVVHGNKDYGTMVNEITPIIHLAIENRRKGKQPINWQVIRTMLPFLKESQDKDL